jgi:hypothetical protein
MVSDATGFLVYHSPAKISVSFPGRISKDTQDCGKKRGDAALGSW